MTDAKSGDAGGSGDRAFADGGKADDIGGTRVVATWFRGKQVYHAASP
jgi:hypothetical protein